MIAQLSKNLAKEKAEAEAAALQAEEQKADAERAAQDLEEQILASKKAS